MATFNDVRNLANRLARRDVEVSLRQRCPECGFKIRGANHADGKHHQNGKKGKCEIK